MAVVDVAFSMVLVRICGSFVNFSLHQSPLRASTNFLYKCDHSCQAPTSKFLPFSSTALSCALNEFPVEENILCSPDAENIQGENLGIGLNRNGGISCGLVDNRAPIGELDFDLRVLDEFSGYRYSSSWNKMISLSTEKKLYSEVSSLFSRMRDKTVGLDDGAVSNILWACCGAKVPFHFVQQIHAKIIRCGFSTSSHVCISLLTLIISDVPPNWMVVCISLRIMLC